LRIASEQFLDSFQEQTETITDKNITNMKIFLTNALLTLVTVIGAGRYCDARMTPLFLETGVRNSDSDSGDAEKAISPKNIRRLKGHQHHQNHRDLQTCEALLAELPGLENSDHCTCQAVFGTSILEVTCDFDCNVCEGGFGTALPQTCADFESRFFMTRDGAVVSNMECVQYTMGRTERLCLEYVDTKSCTVTLNGTACNSCDWTICADGSWEPLVDCSNFDGALWNTCFNNVQIPLSSPFAPLSRRFFPLDECYAQLPDQEQIIEATTPPSRAPVMAPFNGNGNVVLDDTSLRAAVDLWFSDRATAAGAYGSISDWDVSQVGNMSDLFLGMRFFNDDISLWNVSSVTNTNSMFYGAASFNGDISTWDVGRVTDMGGMFNGATNFNQPLYWDTCSLENVDSMFTDAASFNQDLSLWNMTTVDDMAFMFHGAGKFNGDVSTWDVRNVLRFASMFEGAMSFNGDVRDWEPESVVRMNRMFSGASSFTRQLCWEELDCQTPVVGGMFCGSFGSFEPSCMSEQVLMITGCGGVDPAVAFNWCEQLASSTGSGQAQPSLAPVVAQPTMFDENTLRNAVLMWKNERSRAIDTYGPIGEWDVSGVSNMERLFQNDEEFNDDISSWNTSNVISTYIMFARATSFNQPLSSWNTSKVKNMGYMFYEATAFNQPLSSWDTSKVINMGYMFYQATAFNQPLSSLDTSNVLLFDGMFESALVFNGDLRDWNTSSARSMRRMFYNADSFSQELCWDLSQVQTLSELLCSTPASFDPSCTQSNILSIARCNGKDPSSPTPSPVAPNRPSSNARGNDDDNDDDDPALSTGVVFVIVLAIFTGALALILLYCHWQLGRVSERLGAGAASGKDANEATEL
jgi:surface protein